MNMDYMESLVIDNQSFDAGISDSAITTLQNVLSRLIGTGNIRDAMMPKEIADEIIDVHMNGEYISLILAVYSNLTTEDGVSLENKQLVEAHLASCKSNYNKYLSEVCRIAPLFTRAGIPVIVYKGISIVDYAYQDNCNLRDFFDLDLIIHPEDYLKVRDILLSDGYRIEEGWPQNYVVEEDIGRFNDHLPSFSKFNELIGKYYKIDLKHTGCSEFDQSILFDHAQSYHGLLRCSLVDEFVLSALHLLKHFPRSMGLLRPKSLKWVIDCGRLFVKIQQRNEVPILLESIREYNVESSIHLCMKAVKIVTGNCQYENALKQIDRLAFLNYQKCALDRYQIQEDSGCVINIRDAFLFPNEVYQYLKKKNAKKRQLAEALDNAFVYQVSCKDGLLLTTDDFRFTSTWDETGISKAKSDPSIAATCHFSIHENFGTYELGFTMTTTKAIRYARTKCPCDWTNNVIRLTWLLDGTEHGVWLFFGDSNIIEVYDAFSKKLNENRLVFQGTCAVVREPFLMGFNGLEIPKSVLGLYDHVSLRISFTAALEEPNNHYVTLCWPAYSDNVNSFGTVISE